MTSPTRGKPVRPSRSSGSVTLGQVAELAGVSPITVSRVLNRPELVTAETLTTVRAAITRTGYVPNLLAGGLASRRSRLVAAIVPTIASSLFAETVEALSERLEQAGYKVLLGLSGYPPAGEDELIAAVLSRRPDGVLLTGTAHSAQTRKRLLAAKIPVVETWDLTSTPIDMLVGFSHEKIGRAVAKALLEKGHRRFGMVWADDERAAVRRRGFLSYLKKQGIEDVSTSSVAAPGTIPRGREGMAALLAAGRRPDAVFCSSDVLAHGALIEAQARGVQVPGEVAIIGFGDLDFTAFTHPALSTVRIDRRAIGRQAAEALLARLEGRADGQTVVDVGFEVIDRAST